MPSIARLATDLEFASTGFAPQVRQDIINVIAWMRRAAKLRLDEAVGLLARLGRQLDHLRARRGNPTDFSEYNTACAILDQALRAAVTAAAFEGRIVTHDPFQSHGRGIPCQVADTLAFLERERRTCGVLGVL